MTTLLTRRLGEYREEMRRERDDQMVRDPDRIVKLVNSIGNLESVRMRLNEKLRNEADVIRAREEYALLATLLRRKLEGNLALLWEIACEYNFGLGRSVLGLIQEAIEEDARRLGQLGPDEHFPGVDELIPPLSHGLEDSDESH